MYFYVTSMYSDVPCIELINGDLFVMCATNRIIYIILHSILCAQKWIGFKFYILGLELQSDLLISKTAQKTDKRIFVFNDAQIVRYFLLSR